jgi:ubiquinone/menaquinone biosynthesis C-methylase UbiE
MNNKFDYYKRLLTKMIKNYTNYLVNKTIRSIYITKSSDFKLIENLITSYVKKKETEEQVLTKFTNYINSLQLKPKNNDTTSYKSDYITESVDITPTNILDIGAGDGSILNNLKQHYNLPKESVYALDLQPIKRDDITVIGYTDDMKIPFEDGKIDLVVMLSLLHHVPERDGLLAEVSRVLSPNGRVIIREHDGSNNDREYYIFLQLLHYVWYIHNNESKDPLILMTREETLQLFAKHNFVSHTYIKPIGNSNMQKIYGEVYKKINI